MDLGLVIILVILAIVVFVVIAPCRLKQNNSYLSYGSQTQTNTSQTKPTSNNKTIQTDMVLYTLKSCSACEEQNKYISADQPMIEFDSKGNVIYSNCQPTIHTPYNTIDGFPFWVNQINGSTHLGVIAF